MYPRKANSGHPRKPGKQKERNEIQPEFRFPGSILPVMPDQWDHKTDPRFSSTAFEIPSDS